MGREVRMVPPNWQHPMDKYGHFQPMYNRTFAAAAAEWKKEFAAWEAGTHPDYHSKLEYWEWADAPPDKREFYRPWSDAEATWFQLWETVSEGTPVTPPFATKEELIDYLVTEGDLWDEGRGWSRENARRFVEVGHAPSFIVVRSETDTKIFEPRDGGP